MGQLSVITARCPSLAAQITVGSNVQVSKAHADRVHNEVLVDADPANPSRLIACAIVEPLHMAVEKFAPTNLTKRQQTIAYASYNGGRSWSPAWENPIRESKGNADPTCAWGPGDRAYFVTLFWDERLRYDSMTGDSIHGFFGGMTGHYSPDAGKTWQPSRFPPATRDVDREYLVVDHTSGRYQGRVYIFGQMEGRTIAGGSQGSGIAFWRSLDGGATYERPAIRFTEKPSFACQCGNAVVLADGTVVGLYTTFGLGKTPAGAEHTLEVVSSSNGGESVSQGAKVADIFGEPAGGTPITLIPSLAVDRSDGPFRDRLYATWVDMRSDRMLVHLAFSSDKGKTWSHPRVVEDVPPVEGKMSAAELQARPMVAVNRAGVVGVAWYDRRDNPDGFGYHVRFAASFDGGETFVPSVKVSEAPHAFGPTTELSTAAGSLSAKNGDDEGIGIYVEQTEWPDGGHTAGMSADAAGGFHPVWVDNRTGIHQVWTAAVTVDGAALLYGSPDLALLEDVSEQIRLDLTDHTYDAARGAFIIVARIRNLSQTAIRGPLKLRVTQLVSEAGTASIVNADNGLKGVGAIWDFTPQLSGGALAPGQPSGVRKLEIALRNPRMLKRDGWPVWDLVRIRGYVYGVPARSAR